MFKNYGMELHKAAVSSIIFICLLVLCLFYLANFLFIFDNNILAWNKDYSFNAAAQFTYIHQRLLLPWTFMTQESWIHDTTKPLTLTLLYSAVPRVCQHSSDLVTWSVIYVRYMYLYSIYSIYCIYVYNLRICKFDCNYATHTAFPRGLPFSASAVW